MKFGKIFLLLAFLASACGSEDKSTQSFYQGFTNNTWETAQTVSFPFQVSDTSMLYNINAKLRYQSDYTFSTLDLSVSLLTPTGSSRYKKIHLAMRDNNGEQQGTVQKNFIELPFELYDSMRFNESGEWILNFNHHMPVDINRGLVGLEVFIETNRQ